METALDLPKLRTREQGVPAKVLLVDDDELELSLMSDRLRHAGFEVALAGNGEEALTLLEKQWYPIVLTDWQMPVMDGIDLVERLRARGDDSYFIMLSVRTSPEDFERGYCAGVDDYLSKKSPDTEIMARIHAGLNTVALRRSLRQSRAALAVASAQVQHAESDQRARLLALLNAELTRAKRYRRGCSALMVGLRAGAERADAANVADEYLQALQGMVRQDIDAVFLYEHSALTWQYVLVLPETGPAEVTQVRHRVRAELERVLRERGETECEVSVGAASLDPALDLAALTAEQFLATAEQCRRCMASNGARCLPAVQMSVVNQVAIPCRYGYAVADHCLELDHRYALEGVRRPRSEQQTAAGGEAA